MPEFFREQPIPTSNCISPTDKKTATESINYKAVIATRNLYRSKFGLYNVFWWVSPSFCTLFNRFAVVVVWGVILPALHAGLFVFNPSRIASCRPFSCIRQRQLDVRGRYHCISTENNVEVLVWCYKSVTATRYSCPSNFVHRTLRLVVPSHNPHIFLVEDKLTIGWWPLFIRFTTILN